MMREIQIPALDGTLLPATLFEPPDPRAAVIVSPATATPRRFYRAFCDYLARHGAIVVTYDYRGTFEPAAQLRSSRARMRDWGELDFAGVIEWVNARYPALPLYAVGHSVGGHALLMTPSAAKIAGAVNVASQSGYWRLYRGGERYRVYLFVKAIMPALTALLGYFPGELVAFGTNLAPGVLYEWSTWCVSPGYFFDDPTMAPVLANAQHLHAPVLMLGLSDDPWATPRAIEALAPAFTAARWSFRELDPNAFGLGAVGHMGFFRSANSALWPIVRDTLNLQGERNGHAEQLHVHVD
ncbi:MAG TPA: alpha/beta hydrolase [Candidatus Acidoferrales bacterium]|nr:alpha/beta hydrolase [Candidatus Acidoferrales bacterium]